MGNELSPTQVPSTVDLDSVKLPLRQALNGWPNSDSQINWCRYEEESVMSYLSP